MRKTEFISGLIVLISFVSASSYSQTDSLGGSYFPFNTGDMWEYIVYHAPGVTDTAQVLNIKDTVVSDGTIALTQYRRFIDPVVHDPYLDSLRYRVDTLNSQVFQLHVTDPKRDPNLPLYTFNIQPGDQWVLYDYSKIGGVGYEVARVKDIYEGLLFGKSTSFVQFHYYLAQDSTDTLGLDREYVTLAKGFGVVESFPAEGGYWYVLKGAVINGILYGDTTNVITSVKELPNASPRDFELFQNYPNPFNPSTTITFSLDVSARVSLIIYDILGRGTEVLIQDEPWPAGQHEVRWDGANNYGLPAPAGVYFYQLAIGGRRLARSMILLR